ncbi:MAG: hypothetical protein IPN97_08260 [Saprospiraceae bacterium]|nr:hypothetical protein [Saprospiraceae bacterium]
MEDGVKAHSCFGDQHHRCGFSDGSHSKSPAKIYVETHCENRGKKISYSVIAEIKGSENQMRLFWWAVILDSWDVEVYTMMEQVVCIPWKSFPF